jgi:hypothetical protein
VCVRRPGAGLLPVALPPEPPPLLNPSMAPDAEPSAVPPVPRVPPVSRVPPVPAVPPVAPLPESRSEAVPVTEPTAPETGSLDPLDPDPEPDPETPPVTPETMVVCPAMVEIAEVTVPIGSTGPPSPRCSRLRRARAARRRAVVSPQAAYEFVTRSPTPETGSNGRGRNRLECGAGGYSTLSRRRRFGWRAPERSRARSRPRRRSAGLRKAPTGAW